MKRAGAKFAILKSFCREEKKHILHKTRYGRKKYLSDYEIISHSQYPNEYPSNEIPVIEAEVPQLKVRRASEWLYENFKEKCKKKNFFNPLDNWHRNLVWFDLNQPILEAGAWVAPNATVIGSVILDPNTSVWYGAVIRGDLNKIRIGKYTNVQDGAIITTDDKPGIGNLDTKVLIGDFCTIGHGAKLHACKIEDVVTIGMGATILEGAIIEEGAVIAAGAVIPPGTRVPHKEMWAGNPAVFKRHVGKVEYMARQIQAFEYYNIAKDHSFEWTTNGRIHLQVEKLLSEMEKNVVEEEELPEAQFNVWKKMGSPGQEQEIEIKKNLEEHLLLK